MFDEECGGRGRFRYARNGHDGWRACRIAPRGGQPLRIAPHRGVPPLDGKDALLRALFLEGMMDVRATFAAADPASMPAERLEHLLRACEARILFAIIDGVSQHFVLEPWE